MILWALIGSLVLCPLLWLMGLIDRWIWLTEDRCLRLVSISFILFSTLLLLLLRAHPSPTESTGSYQTSRFLKRLLFLPSREVCPLMMQMHYWFQTLISQKWSKGHIPGVKELTHVEPYVSHSIWIYYLKGKESEAQESICSHNSYEEALQKQHSCRCPTFM